MQDQLQDRVQEVDTSGEPTVEQVERSERVDKRSPQKRERDRLRPSPAARQRQININKAVAEALGYQAMTRERILREITAKELLTLLESRLSIEHKEEQATKAHAMYKTFSDFWKAWNKVFPDARVARTVLGSRYGELAEPMLDAVRNMLEYERTLRDTDY